VGGGFGGVKTALELANVPGIEVKLISQNAHFEYHGALYRSATGRSPLEVVIPLRDIFAQVTNVEVILDEVVDLDPKKRRVVGSGGALYSYDKLVMAIGLIPNFFGIDGMKQHANTLYTIRGAIALRQSLVSLARKRAGKAAHVAIIGAGASGVELAGDVPQFMKIIAKKYGLNRTDLRVSLIEGGPRILPLLNERASQKAAARLQKLKVDTFLNSQVNSCEERKVCLKADNLQADVIVWTAGSRNHPFFEEHHKIFTLAKNHKVVVNDYLEAAPDIYVLGDNAATPYSGMAQTALHDAIYVASMIRLHSKGHGALPYAPQVPLYVVPVGPRWAVVQSGDRVTSGYSGWLLRRRADLFIFENFEPFEMAIKTWRRGNRQAQF
jgi:NADH dehydrogenase